MNKQCLLILGMHRSGTSVLTRILSLCGAQLPKNLLGANEENSSGYWEPEHIVAINDELLAECSSCWDDWREFSYNHLPEPRRDYYRKFIGDTLQEEYEGAPFIVLKDPRIGRFVQFYSDILSDLGYEVLFIHTSRHPVPVAASLQKRDQFPEAFGTLLWLRHILDAEFVTRGQPRVFVSYEDLIADAKAVADKIAAKFPSALRCADVEAEVMLDFVNPSQQHHTTPVIEKGPKSGIEELALDVHTALRALESDESNSQALKALDHHRARFNDVSVIAGDAHYAMRKAYETELNRRNELMAGLKQQLGQGDISLEELKQQLGQRDSSLEELKQQLGQRDTSLEELKQQLGQRDTSLEELKRQLSQSDFNMAEAMAQLLDARKHPIKHVTRLLFHKALKKLLESGLPLPLSMTKRIEKITRKPDPFNSDIKSR
mgnify:CR=1 FL=1